MGFRLFSQGSFWGAFKEMDSFDSSEPKLSRIQINIHVFYYLFSKLCDELSVVQNSSKIKFSHVSEILKQTQEPIMFNCISSELWQ